MNVLVGECSSFCAIFFLQSANFSVSHFIDFCFPDARVNFFQLVGEIIQSGSL